MRFSFGYSVGLLMVLAGVLLSIPASADYYVDGVNGNNGFAGTSWGAAKATIQAAVTVAPAGTTIHVAASPSGYMENVLITRSYIVLGGYPAGGGGRNPAVNETIINGAAADCAVTLQNIGSLEIDGFSIINGSSSQGGGICCQNCTNVTIINCYIHGNTASRYGAGIFSDHGEISIEGSRINENTTHSATQRTGGGGIYLTVTSASITDSDISGNQCDSWGANVAVYGGGVYCTGSLIMDNCTVDDNTAMIFRSGGTASFPTSAVYGGGIYVDGSVDVSDSQITNNNAQVEFFNTVLDQANFGSQGGGIYADGSSATVTGCTISSNLASVRSYDIPTLTASAKGGGISCMSSDGNISANTLESNQCFASGSGTSSYTGNIYGGAIYIYQNDFVDIGGNMIKQNEVQGPAGSILKGSGIACIRSFDYSITNNFILQNNYMGISVYIYFSGSVINNTIANNTAYGIHSSSNLLTVKNNILWNNDDDIEGAYSSYCDIEDGDSGVGNLSCTPDFVSSNDLHLQITSCCLENGTATGAPAMDFDGEIRPMGSGIDIGADEVDNQPTATPTSTPSPTMTPTEVPRCSSGYQEVIVLEQDFESWPLFGWDIINNGGDCVWRSGSDDQATGIDVNYTGGSGDYADADSDDCGSTGYMDTELHSPVMDFSGLLAPRLTFKSDMRWYSSGNDEAWIVDLSIDGGGSWSNLLTRSGQSYRGPETIQIDMPQAEGEDNVVIRFYYANAAYEFWWQLDDVQITACQLLPTPTPSPRCQPGTEVQTILTADFVTFPPDGWTIVNNGGDCVWHAGLPDTNYTGGTGDYADADSYDCGSGTYMDTELRTPFLDLTNFLSPVLEFKSDMYWYLYGGNEKWDVDYWTGSGDWINLLHREGQDYPGPETITLDLSAVEGNPSVMIRFRYWDAEYDNSWQVDDVLVTACAPIIETGTLNGSLSFQRAAAAPDSSWESSISVELCVDGSSAGATVATTDVNGDFQLEEPAGDYDIIVKAPHSLATQALAIHIPAGGSVAVDFGTQPEGDVNDDNIVTSADFFILRSAYNSGEGDPAFDSRADLNGDGVVTSLDFFLLRANYNSGGADCS